MPLEKLKKLKPLKEGLVAVKEELIEEVLAVVAQFVEALQKISIEEEKLKGIVTNKIEFLRRLKSQKPIIENFQATRSGRLKVVKLSGDYWFYLGVVQHMSTCFHEVRKLGRLTTKQTQGWSRWNMKSSSLSKTLPSENQT